MIPHACYSNWERAHHMIKQRKHAQRCSIYFAGCLLITWFCEAVAYMFGLQAQITMTWCQLHSKSMQCTYQYKFAIFLTLATTRLLLDSSYSLKSITMIRRYSGVVMIKTWGQNAELLLSILHILLLCIKCGTRQRTLGVLCEVIVRYDAIDCKNTLQLQLMPKLAITPFQDANTDSTGI